MEMREFEEHDWDGFAGAESVPGKPPMIGGEGEILFIVDINGIEIDYGIAGIDDFQRMDCSYDMALFLAKHLTTEDIYKEYLKSLGFYSL